MSKSDGRSKTPPDKKQVEAKILFGSSTPPTPKSTRPRVLFSGKVRKRIPCSIEDLAKLDAAADQELLARALRIVEGVNLDDMYFDDVVRFGAGLQAEHGAITEGGLVLSQDKVLTLAQTLVAKILALFEELNPDTVFAVKANSLFEALKSLWTPPRSIEDILAYHYPNMLFLARKLKGLEPDLVQVQDKFSALTSRYNSLDDKIAAYILAANYIAQYVRSADWDKINKAHYASQADALETRAASLLATRVTLKAGLFTQEVLQTSAQALVGSSRGLLEESLPAFQTAYTVAIAAVRSTPASRDTTWLQPLRDVHAGILKTLK